MLRDLETLLANEFLQNGKRDEVKILFEELQSSLEQYRAVPCFAETKNHLRLGFQEKTFHQHVSIIRSTDSFFKKELSVIFIR